MGFSDIFIHKAYVQYNLIFFFSPNFYLLFRRELLYLGYTVQYYCTSSVALFGKITFTELQQ